MRIGLLTGGGDAPGLNAAIRAVVLRSRALGHEVIGVADGWAGLTGEPRTRDLWAADVHGILGLGGTILGTTRTDPRKNGSAGAELVANIHRIGLDALVTIGGNDTLGVADWLHGEGVHVVGIPKTVDNDLAETSYCIGFDTAVTVVAEAVDRLRTTASAHHRVVVVEAMGRDAGWVAAYGGLTGGADLVIVPEIPVSADDVVSTVHQLRAEGDQDTIIVVAEAADIAGLDAQAPLDRDAFGHPRLDQRAIGAVLARLVEARARIEARVVVLGHLQRSGSPTATDRLWATRFGNEAADLVDAGRFGILPVAQGGSIAVATLRDAVRVTRRVGDDVLTLLERYAGIRTSTTHSAHM